MKEELLNKIVKILDEKKAIDVKNHTYVWIDGKEIKYTTKIKFEVSEDNSRIPNIEIKKDFLPIQKVGFTKPKIKMDGKDIGEYYPGKFLESIDY